MRTTLNLDEDTLSKVILLTGQKDRSKAVRAALEAYLQQTRKRAVLDLAGTLTPLPDWETMRDLANSDTYARPKDRQPPLLPRMQPCLIDTPAWVHFLSQTDAPDNHLVEQAIHSDTARICGVIIAELLQIFAAPDHPALDLLFTQIPSLASDETTMAHAGKAVQTAKEKGEMLPLNTAVVTATANAHQVALMQ